MKLSFIAVLALCFSASVFAAPAKQSQQGGFMDKPAAVGNPDVIDGCGLGWQITQKRTMMATTTRGTTNAFVPPTFGMTSGTIGCEQLQFAAAEQDSATYAMKNFENLRIEMAAGEGENLAAFAETLGCSSSELGSITKSSYGTIMKDASESPAQMYRNLKAEIAARGACGA